MLTDKEKQIWDLMDEMGRITSQDRALMRTDEEFAKSEIEAFRIKELANINSTLIMNKLHKEALDSSDSLLNNRLNILKG